MKDYSAAGEIIRHCLNKGIPENALREAIIQTYLFDGYPTALEGLFLLGRILPDESHPPPAQPLNSATLNHWFERGEQTCRIIYRDNYSKLWENVNRLSPDLGQWMLFEGYGKVLSRKGLELSTRELTNVAILAVKYYPRQLHSHLKGCINTGVDPEALSELLRLLHPFSPKNVDMAIILWDDLSSLP